MNTKKGGWFDLPHLPITRRVMNADVAFSAAFDLFPITRVVMNNGGLETIEMLDFPITRVVMNWAAL